MPAKRIPQLPTLTGAGSVAGDKLLIYDADLDVTKSITRNELAIGLQQDLPAIPTVGTLGAQDADAVNITGGTISGVALTLGTPLPIADGGTGSADATAARAALSAAKSGANSDITSLTGLTTPISILQGGTGATTAANARAALDAAKRGANSDITSLTGLLTPLSIAQGGTGATTAAAALAALGGIGVTTSLIANNGYIQLGPLTLQWGRYLPGGYIGPNTYGITYPVAFATATLAVMITTIATNAGDDAWPQVQNGSWNTTGFTCRTQEEDGGNSNGFFWFAIGH